MRISLRWLGEYVNLPGVPVEELCERLTLAGIEVEEAENLAAEGVTVGRVTEVEPHPHAPGLKVCTVEAGPTTHSVVCGAPNVSPGILAPLALPGARLPQGTLAEATIRGVRSEGMLLSREELGLEPKSSGIWELPNDTPLGADLSQLLELPDVVLLLKITSNRPDLLGIYGLAREISALFKTELGELELGFPEEGPRVEELAAVEVESSEDCPRYLARVIQGVDWRPSPVQLQARLLKAQLRPISLVVDATNYAMLELGHPLHAFDHQGLEGQMIVVRRARKGERLRTLDGVDRELSPEVLVIADEKKPVAVAGIMGGEETGVKEGTRTVLLEAAVFSPARVRRGSRSLGLRTEASLRFERGLSPEGADPASRRVCTILSRYAPVRIARGAVDAYLSRPAPRTLVLRRDRVAQILGLGVPEEEVEGLRRLGLELARKGEDWEVKVPAFRMDLEREIDLIEEVGRLYGYDRIPALAPRVFPRLAQKDAEEAFADRIRKIMAALGLSEAYTFPLVPQDQAEVVLANPMAQGQEGLRRELWPGLLEAAKANLSAQVAGVALFEVGKVFFAGDGVGEEYRLGVILAGRPPIPLSGKAEHSPSDLKGILDGLLEALRIEGAHLGEVEAPHLHPYRQAGIYLAPFASSGNPGSRELIGWLGELHPDRCRDLPGEHRVLLLELRLPPLERAAQAGRYQPLPRFPPSKRDLSLLVPEGVPEAEVRARLSAEPLVESVFLYDLYRGKGIPERHLSLTYELVFRHPERTLSSEEVEEAVQRLLGSLEDLGVHLRT